MSKVTLTQFDANGDPVTTDPRPPMPRTPGMAMPHSFVANMRELGAEIRDALQSESSDAEHDALSAVADLMGLYIEDPNDDVDVNPIEWIEDVDADGKPIRTAVIDDDAPRTFEDNVADTQWIEDYAADIHIEGEDRQATIRKTGLGMGKLHADIFQRYYGDCFWTVCECGLQFSGVDPDDADFNHMTHREANEKADAL
jgi:hypothetical protein